MQYNRNLLYKALKHATNASVIAGLASVSAPVFAQDQEDSADLGQMEVTGSRIRRADIEGANPVTVLDRDDISRTGLTDLGELIQSLPSISGSPLSTQRNNGGNGAVRADLRGMGANRTLVLINGRREPSLFGDFSTFPLAAVERVEILKDGASAVYGADAVAGVVNVITRRDFEGAEVEMQIGESFNEGGQVKDASFIMGGNSDRGNFVFGIDYSETEEAFQSAWDEEWINTAVTVLDPTGFAQFGYTPFNSDPGGDGTPDIVSLGSSRIPNGRFRIAGGPPVTLCDGADPTNPASYTCAPGTYNYAPVNYLQTPYTRRNFFFQGDYQLFDNVNAYAEARYSNRSSEQILAPIPYDTRFDPAFDDINGIAISEDNFYNPFGAPVTEWRRRIVETGGRSFTQDINQYQIVAGLRGDFASTWTWDISYNYGNRARVDTDFGQFSGARLANALGPSFLDPATGQVTCGTPSAPIAGCVSLNPFGGVGTITQDMLDYVSIPLNDRIDLNRQVFNATITGDLFDVPAGAVGAAFGYEYRDEEYTFTPDSAKATDQTTGNTGAGTDGTYDVDSLFAELNIPILSGVSGAEVLELGLSARYDDFSTFGSTTNYNASIRWQPISGLLIRGTYNDVFREPNISEQFAGVGDSFPNASDPCNASNWGLLSAEGRSICISQGVPDGGYIQSDNQVRTRVGGNPNLEPEEGSTKTFGLAWSPNAVDGLTLTLDYWEIDLDVAINTPSANVVLSGCYTGAVPEFCNSITRLPGGNINTVQRLVQPVGAESAKGWDFSARYDWNTDFGLWNFSWLATLLDERNLLVLRDSDGNGVAEAVETNVSGRYEHRSLFRPSAYHEWKHNFNVDWSQGDWGASLRLELLDDLTECGSPFSVYACPDDGGASGNEPEFTVDSVLYVDLIGRYTIPSWGSTVSVGITNLTDEELPFINQGFNSTTDPDTYRAFGRSWYVNFKHSF